VDAKVGEENKQFYNLALAPEPLPEVQVGRRVSLLLIRY